MADNFKKSVVNSIHAAVKDLPKKKISDLIETPHQEYGDYAFPCFILARSLKKSPPQIAKYLENMIKPNKYILKIESKGPYVNFYLNTAQLASSTINSILKLGSRYGSKSYSGKTIMVEYFHANTHKAVHLGHIRNICLGEAICRILSFNGHKIVRVNYQGDIGPHVAKCLWGLLNLASDKEPQKGKLRYLADIYEKANNEIEGNEKLETDVKELLQRIYAGDKKLNDLWKKTRKWCLDEFEELYKDFWVKFDHLYFESEMEFKARDISKDLVKKGIAKLDAGAIIADLKPYSLGIFVLLTKNGTALYSSKDIALANLKMSQYNLDTSIHVVGKEQELHFKQLFKTLQLMGPSQQIFAKNSHHLIYGLVMLPEGKMSSRKGLVVFYDDLINELFSLAVAEVKKRHPDWTPSDITESGRMISFAALKFGMINRDNEKILTFDWNHALSFEGETGPYVQYAHARICSILEKHVMLPKHADFTKLKTPEESIILKMLADFPHIVEYAGSEMKPLIVTRYLINLSKAFNNFYHAHSIIKAEAKIRDARLLLIVGVRQVIRNGLDLLAIQAPAKM